MIYFTNIIMSIDDDITTLSGSVEDSEIESNDEGEQKTLRIVGVDEIYDHHPQHISIDSPMARALLSKQVDDEVEVLTPLGKKCWYINSIRYEMGESTERQ